MRARLRLLRIASLLLLLLFPSGAQAFEKFTVGGGLLGVAGANFLDKPSDKTIALPNGQRGETPTYPGFAGLTAGFGFFAEVRVIDYVGVEFDVFRTSDKGSGDLTLTVNGEQRKWNITVGHAAWHLPLLIKGVIPGKIVQPSLFLGPEFVIPDGPEVKGAPEPGATLGGETLSTTYDAFSEGYAMFCAGFGVEFKLPLPKVDVRIPLSIRGGYNPGVEDALEDRAKYEVKPGSTDPNIKAITKIEYKTTWQYQAIATLGASIHF
ncbi:MAG: hypothetical protein HY744_17720 [Deltaproteobacteria bacterium]|nr:hypothetical protein [Deltaproteobacteria bacterium]